MARKTRKSVKLDRERRIAEGDPFGDNNIKEILGPDTKRQMAIKSVEIKATSNFTMDKAKYNKRNERQQLFFRHGYNLLQYNIVVRPYITKKFNVSELHLDVLLYIYPFQYFSSKDYKRLPVARADYKAHLKLMLEQGYVQKTLLKKDNGNAIYELTDHSKRIVEDYYQMLSGEKTVHVDAWQNPFKGPDTSKIDSIRNELLETFKQKTLKNPDKYMKGTYDK